MGKEREGEAERGRNSSVPFSRADHTLPKDQPTRQWKGPTVLQ